MVDPRRVDNQLSDVRSSHADLFKAHMAMAETVVDQAVELEALRLEVDGLKGRFDLHVHLYQPEDYYKPIETSQPVVHALDDCPKCNNTGTITKSLTGYGMSSQPCDCGRAPVAMNQPAALPCGCPDINVRSGSCSASHIPPQPAADDARCETCGRGLDWCRCHEDQPAADDAEKWEAVQRVLASDMGAIGKPLYPCPSLKGTQAAVTEAVKQGLVMRNIDPNDPDLVQVVAEVFEDQFYREEWITERARRVLAALAVELGGNNG